MTTGGYFHDKRSAHHAWWFHRPGTLPPAALAPPRVPQQKHLCNSCPTLGALAEASAAVSAGRFLLEAASAALAAAEAEAAMEVGN
eukprot:606511-Pelagomonas_calceolata.AAC.2